MTMFLVGTAVGQLLFGVFSDQFGRCRFIIAGTTLAVLAGLIAVVVPNIWVLYIGRFLQGLGSAAGMVLGRAVVADSARGIAAAKARGLMMAIQGIAPVHVGALRVLVPVLSAHSLGFRAKTRR